MKSPLKIAISGIGNRALPRDPHKSNWHGWIELISKSGDFQLVAGHDTDYNALKRIVERGYLKTQQAYHSLSAMLKAVECDALLVSNPARYHARTIREALEYNLHVLIEKPFVADARQGRALLREAGKRKRVMAVVQNWRCKDAAEQLREAVQNGLIGDVGHIFFRYIRHRENPAYPSYIFEEKYPLLYAMGIHHLDLFRYILGDEFISVSGNSFKPSWSLYKSDTGANLFLKTKNGVSIVYSGTISSMNSVIPQESLLIEGSKGSLANESQWLEPPLYFYPKGKKEKINLSQGVKDISVAGQYNRADKLILRDFYNAIAKGKAPICGAEDALQSVAVIEASCAACRRGKVIRICQR